MAKQELFYEIHDLVWDRVHHHPEYTEIEKLYDHDGDDWNDIKEYAADEARDVIEDRLFNVCAAELYKDITKILGDY